MLYSRNLHNIVKQLHFNDMREKKVTIRPLNWISVFGWDIPETKASTTQFKWRGGVVARVVDQPIFLVPQSPKPEVRSIMGGGPEWCVLGYRIQSGDLFAQKSERTVTSCHKQASPTSHKKNSNHCQLDSRSKMKSLRLAPHHQPDD